MDFLMLFVFLIAVLVSKRRSKLKIEINLWSDRWRLAARSAGLHSIDLTTMFPFYAIGLLSVPTPSISTSTRSPAFMRRVSPGVPE
jgi:hypothetical protein